MFENMEKDLHDPAFLAHVDQSRAFCEQASQELVSALGTMLVAKEADDTRGLILAATALQATMKKIDFEKALELVGWLALMQLKAIVHMAGGREAFLRYVAAGTPLPCVHCGNSNGHSNTDPLEELFNG